MRKKIWLLTAALLCLTGCTYYYDCTAGKLDEIEDAENREYLNEMIAVAEQRSRFKRPLEIKMSEKAHLFLNPGVAPQLSLAQKRELLAVFGSELAKVVGGLRDFALVNTETTARNVPGPQIIQVPENPAKGNYVMTFNILRADVRDLGHYAHIGAGIAAISGADRRAVAITDSVHWFYGTVRVEVMLTSPEGKNIFTFSRKVVSPEYLPYAGGDVELLKAAVAEAARRALKGYGRKFGPPLYVVDSTGDGLFVKLSHGTEYGLAEGQKIRFYRNVRRRTPVGPGGETYRRRYLGTGVVGAYLHSMQ